MTRTRANLAIFMLGGALAPLFAGCVQPWAPTFTEGKNARTHAPATAATTPVIPSSSADPAAVDMAGVMDKLAQIRTMDPAAEEKLLAELKRTPPNTWPLVVEQFRASLAYHQQLAAKVPRSESYKDQMAEFRTTPATSATNATVATSDSGKPSATIGSLVDPRTSSTERDATIAQSSPFSMPTPIDSDPTRLALDPGAPAEFASSGPVYPITTAREAAVETAAFQSPVNQPVTSAGDRFHPNREPRSPVASTDGEWQDLVQQATTDLSKRVSPSPTTTAEVHQHASLRLLRLLAGDTEKALEPIPHIPPAEQDYWSRQIFALATYLDHHSQPDDKRRAAASVAHLDEAVSHLRELGSLSLRNLTFCKNVYGYGAYEPYDNDVFSPGQQVSLYLEVENYHSESTDKGYCTKLGATYELLDDKGKRVSGGEFPDIDDCCHSRRRDFHIQLGLSLPENLPAGHYRVELVVKDRQSDKLGHSTVPFEIRGGRK